MNKSVILTFLIAIPSIAVLMLFQKINRMNETISIQAANIKAYQSEISGLKDDTQTYLYTIDQINASRDTMIQYLDSLRKTIKVKDKNLKSMSYIKTLATRRDTIYIDAKLPEYVINIDTIVGDEWLNTHVVLNDSTLVCQPKFKSELAVIASYRKETINPPSRFFFIRWFQKKHKVIRVDVIEANPYAEIKNQKFVEVLK